ncbi:MAG: addiction module protein [Pseudomonadales bacterium]|nr:addiction module protein [Pseudomonadales bacterium]MCP5188097.1 addiction module protein [Pseudomonadales bacterium]
MSTEIMERLRSEALTLSMPERAELAHDLLESLDAPADEGVESAWDEEIIRRIAQIDAGQAKLLSRDEFRRRLQDRLGNV